MKRIVTKIRAITIRCAVVFVSVVCAALGPAATGAPAAELIMFEQVGCPWCVRWHAEIGEIYAKTDEGKKAPLRRVDIFDELPEDLKWVRPETFTPSFVLVDNGKEYGRIRGYPGEDFFWWHLGEMLKKLKTKPQAALTATQ